MQSSRWAALAVAGVFALAIALPARAQDVEVKPTAKIKKDKYVITAEEIAGHAELKDGYDVIRLLRNQWLRPTRTSGSAMGAMAPPSPRVQQPAMGCGRNSTDPACTEAPAGTPRESGTAYADADGASSAQFLPVIYIDEIKREGINDLRALRPAEIFEMRFLTGNQASGRYGSGHENGAIVVKTVRFGKG
jgi:hypothetical protein